MPFKFYCRNCDQKLEAPESLYGKDVTCPQCGQDIKIPDPRRNPEATKSSLKLLTIPCPLCGHQKLQMPEGNYGDAQCPNCKTRIPLHAPSQDSSGHAELPLLRDYLLIRRLGSGGSGTVYEGRQLKLNNRSVAIKVINPELREQWDLAGEAAALVRLAHPCIVRIYDIAIEDEQQGLVMELVTGPHGEPLSLREILVANHNRLSPEAAVKTVLTIATALDYAHQQNVLHLDLKPENILVDHLGMLRLVDFGIARVKTNSDNNTGILQRNTLSASSYGTPGYDAPERHDPDHSDTPSEDIYSLGAILYEAMTGQLPGGRFALPSELDPQLPKNLDSIVETALHFHAEKRYQQLGSFIEALHNLLQQIKASGPTPELNNEHTTNTIRLQTIRPPQTPTLRPGISNAMTTPGMGKKRTGRRAFWMGIIAIPVIALGWLLMHQDKTPKLQNFFNADPASRAQRPAGPTTNGPGEKLYRDAEACFWGKGQPQDTAKALVMLRQAAATGHADSINRLGEILFYGDAGAKAQEEAFRYFTQAAEKECPKAFFNLGECYYFGLGGVPVSYKHAVEYYQKGLNAGSVHAKYGLARCYSTGNGMTKNLPRAQVLLQQAAEEGFAPARDLSLRLQESQP